MSANELPPDLLENISHLIDAHLRSILDLGGRPQDHKMALEGHYRNRGMALQLLEIARPQAELTTLVFLLFKTICGNWTNSTYDSKNDRGERNWRWEPSSEKLGRRETKWERQLMLAANGSPPTGRWVNQIPTGSGLSPKKIPNDTSTSKGKKRAGNTGHIDLAYCEDPGRLIVIEFKLNADNPVSAAFQLVLYVLVLTLAREAGLRIKDSLWRDAKKIDLRVLAPVKFNCVWHKQFYDRRYKLRWFRDRLNDAVFAFGKEHAIEMTFGFCALDYPQMPERPADETPEHLPNEKELLACLDGPFPYRD